MAEKGNAGSLFFGMTLDTKDFKKRLKNVRKDLDKKAKAMREAFASIATGFVAAGAAAAAGTGAMLAFAKSTAEATNEQLLLAKSIGATQSQIAGLDVAATKMGVEYGMLIDKMREFGGVDEFSKLADDVQSAGDAQDQLNKAIEIFGGEGAKLLPVLQLGAEGLRSMEQEAVRLGLALSPEQIAQNNVAWSEFENTLLEIRGLGKQIGTGFLEFFGTTSAGVRGLIKAFGTDFKNAFQATADFLVSSMRTAFDWFADNGIKFINGFISFAEQIGHVFSDVFGFIADAGGSTFNLVGNMFDTLVDFMTTFKQVFIAGISDAIAFTIKAAFNGIAAISDRLGKVVTEIAFMLEGLGAIDEGFGHEVRMAFKEQGDSLREVGEEWASGFELISSENIDEASKLLEEQDRKNTQQRNAFMSSIKAFEVNFSEATKAATQASQENKNVASELKGMSDQRAGLALTGSQEEFRQRQNNQNKMLMVAQKQLKEQEKTNKSLQNIAVG